MRPRLHNQGEESLPQTQETEMANWKGSGPGNNDYPATPWAKLIDTDPMIVKVPLDEVEWGARRSQMARVRAADGFKENRMAIKHVNDNGKGA